MTKRMLIDAAHAEETRVVVVDGTRVEEFDFESQSKKQLRGNIYLAKVTRVEPSLQAAFIEYGGNRHGFLAFNEIHPDYYHIPLADKEALLREEAEEEEAHAKSGGRTSQPRDNEDGEDEASLADDDDDDDVMEEEAERRRRRLMRRYKIQEVIKRRQIMLVQVVKEERGNKGAALTTYLSLAGRYCVLMPNTARGGGISRKITTVTDRKRLKTVVQSLDVPQGMGLIVRTAGAKRTKAEIKRDYEYLLRLWENIREVTMNSIAPALIYEEEDLVKRAIRDMYDKELDGIIVEGEEGYRSAKEFMRMLMPSQAKKIQAYREPTPLFIKARVEDHLAQIYNPTVPLRSGGYIVINQTEALVAIDVNSGRATRERNIEATALKTNCEAAEEAARQLRLRDLAGLIVIDFIDMDEGKNNRAVEKVLKDALKDDRARIQMGKISSFGLMELSRQRRRSGVLEGTTHVCEHCQGTGRVRAVESSALSALRSVEMECVRQGPGEIALKAPRAVALYILNHKRPYLMRMLQSQGLQVTVIVDDEMAHADHEIERISVMTEEERAALAAASPAFAPTYIEPADDYVDVDDEDEDEDEDHIEAEDEISEGSPPRKPVLASEARERDADGEQRRGRGRRRRRGGGGRREEGSDEPRAASPAGEESFDAAADDAEGSDGARRRRRGRRGGRRMREDARPQDVYAWSRVRVPHTDGVYGWFDPSAPAPVAPPAEAREPREPRPAAAQSAPAVYDFVEPAAPRTLNTAPPSDEDIWVELPAAAEAPAKPGRPRRSRSRKPAAEAVVAAPVETAPAPQPEAEAPPQPVVAEAAVIEAPAEAEAAPVKAVRKRKPSAKALAAAAAAEAAAVAEAPAAPGPVPEAAPVVAAAPTPAPVLEVVAAPEPDPAEIAAPPAQPRRGWWRR